MALKPHACHRAVGRTMYIVQASIEWVDPYVVGLTIQNGGRKRLDEEGGQGLVAHALEGKDLTILFSSSQSR